MKHQNAKNTGTNFTTNVCPICEVNFVCRLTTYFKDIFGRNDDLSYRITLSSRSREGKGTPQKTFKLYLAHLEF